MGSIMDLQLMATREDMARALRERFLKDPEKIYGQIMQMLREDPEFHHIPIIFLTGKNDAETVKNVMSLKPDGYLLKSMNPQKLHAAIDDFFASRGK